MKTLDPNDLIVSMSAVWQKHPQVLEVLEKKLRAEAKPTHSLLSRSWTVLQTLKGEGIAQIETDGPGYICRLTPQGLARKNELKTKVLEPQ